MSGNYECWDVVWNPVRGCTPVSEGCRNCVAARTAAHLSLYVGGNEYENLVRWGDGLQPEWTGRIRMDSESLMEPLLLTRAQRILVGSMSDLFHPGVSDEFIGAVFMTMMCNEKHTFYVSTKYALQMEQWFGSIAAWTVIDQAAKCGREWPLPNVIMGISAEDQPTLDERSAHLMGVPAASKFLVLEPLLGSIDTTNAECPVMRGEPCHICGDGEHLMASGCTNGFYNLLLEGIDWVVAGCETGPRSRTRAMKSEWVRALRDQCEQNNKPFYFKQARDARGVRISLPALDGRQWLERPI